jgi:hypothetical protein
MAPINFVCAYMGRADECQECGFFNETGTRFCSVECEANFAERGAEMDARAQQRRDQDDAFGAECERLRALGRTDAEIDELLRGMP